MSSDEFKKFDEIQDLVKQAPAPLRAYIEFLEVRFNEQARQIEELTNRIKELEDSLAKNSSNSGKPPSSDGLSKQPKNQSLRGKTGKKPGGQPGRTGKTLQQIDNPDYIIEHEQSSCGDCGHPLEGVAGDCIEARQVFDIPEPQMVVTEHRLISKSCPCCLAKATGSFPKNVTAHVQYGDRARAMMVYLNNQHLLPFERISQLFEDIYGRKVSPGTITKANRRAFGNLEIFEEDLKAFLLASSILHFDETGIRCQKKTHWIHVSSSQAATFYHVHKKRGREGMIAGGVIDSFRGIGVHDGLKTYYSFEGMQHALCNAHHLRELEFTQQQGGEAWAKEMKELLLRMKAEVEARQDPRGLSESQIADFKKEYASIALKGLSFHVGLKPLPKGVRGRQKQRPGKNLLNRLSDGIEYVLRFLHEPSVPFTNNLAEQDLRMIKVQQKVSGCFRDLMGAAIFCRIRSFVSTARKQGWSILNILMQVIQGQPLPAIAD